MDENFEENLKRGRLLIERLEELQYSSFNCRPKWITIHKDKLKLFMIYTYYGYPSHNKINENNYIKEFDHSDNFFELYENEAKKNILKLNEKLEKYIAPDFHNCIKVGITMTHSICKDKCDICHSFPNKDIHKWILLRLKSIKNEFYVIDFEHNQIYYSWKEYMEKNVLPKGYMFYPTSGFYDASNTLFQTITPASENTNEIVQTIDIGVSIVNWAGVAIAMSSFFFPVAAPIILAASTTLTVSNSYGFTRQIQKLYTMYKHNIEISSLTATQEWISLAISGIGALVSSTFIYTAYKAITSAESSVQVTSKALKIFQKSSCITQSTLDVFRVTLDIIDNNFEITLINVLRLSLDILCITGIVYSPIEIKNILKVLSTGAVWAPIYKTLEQIPYYLGQKIFTAVYFFKNHFAVFVDQVTAFLLEKLTPTNLLFAWKTIRHIFTSYQKQTAELDIGDLLWHVVDNTAETASVKYVLRGPRMVKLLEFLSKDVAKRPMNRAFVEYCVKCVLEIAKKLSKDRDDCGAELARRGETRTMLVDEEFCKVYSWKSYKLEKCSMDQYVLWAIDEVSKYPVKFMDEYQQHASLPEHMFDDEMVVKQTDGDNQSVKGYTFVAPCSVLDFDICLRLAAKINPEHRYNNHEFIQPKPDVSLMINVSAFSFNIVFFGVDVINGVPKMNICFFQQNHDSSLSDGNHKGLKKLQEAH